MKEITPINKKKREEERESVVVIRYGMFGWENVLNGTYRWLLVTPRRMHAIDSVAKRSQYFFCYYTNHFYTQG